ncbi:hypothetical protein MCUN1_003266 [Malassezia cuniculi]|uniref:chitin deacetylase n=1 Tax=Malassezia cuniculi TaxID=948313 RepID=A0AAF0J796_9BASI|nr:hypothetical protein MCUN1_003266 [Malassezia cuniculi]
MKPPAALFVAAAVLATVGPCSAHVGRALAIPDNDQMLTLMRRQASHFRMIKRARTEQSQRQIADAAEQCKWYELPDSERLRNAYPTDGIASIVDGDEQANKLWQEISGSVPSIPVRQGSADHMGIDPSASQSYEQSDPDCWWSATGCTQPKHQGIPTDLKTCPEPRTWGLTFDDGPNCAHNSFYDYLQQNNLHATMFFIGVNVLNYPLQAQRALADGHDICVHTWSHHYMTTLSNEQVFAELFYTMRIIKDVIGVTPRCWRPPFGDTDDRVRAIAEGLGLRTILWSDDTDDWNILPTGAKPTASIDANYERIINKHSADSTGRIVLTHEINSHTMHEFMRMFPQIKRAFPNVVSLSACMNATQPYAESSPTYKSFSDAISGNGSPDGIPQNFTINVASTLDITPLSQQQGGFSSN